MPATHPQAVTRAETRVMSTQAPAIRSVHDTEGAAVIDAFMRPYETDTPLIRMGDFGDGGYLLPDDLRGIAACYSPGVSEQASFEMDMAKRGISSFMADASVERPPLNVPGAEFVRKFLGDKDEGEVMTLASWVAATDPDPGSDLLLQMDIEGAEYATLSAAPRDLLRRFRMIVIEWHHLPSILTKPRFMGPARAAIEKLREDFVTVHLAQLENATGGLVTVYDDDKQPLESFQLHNILDSYLFNDAILWHGVTPIHSDDGVNPAQRGIFTFDFHPMPDLQKPE